MNLCIYTSFDPFRAYGVSKRDAIPNVEQKNAVNNELEHVSKVEKSKFANLNFSFSNSPS